MLDSGVKFPSFFFQCDFNRWGIWSRRKAALERKGVSSKFVIISLGAISGPSVNYRTIARANKWIEEGSWRTLRWRPLA